MLPAKFQFICACSFRGEDFLEIDQPETRIAYGGHVGYQIRFRFLVSEEKIKMWKVKGRHEMAKAHIDFFFLNCTNLKKRGAHLQCVCNHRCKVWIILNENCRSYKLHKLYSLLLFFGLTDRWEVVLSVLSGFRKDY